MLFEQIITDNTLLQPYEYINTEIAEDGHRLVLHLASRKDTAEERCPYCKGHVHICGSLSMRLREWKQTQRLSCLSFSDSPSAYYDLIEDELLDRYFHPSLK